MVSSVFINFFTRPGVVKIFTELNNDGSMTNVIVRDALLDIPGRLYYAAKRDGLGNAEFVEQSIDQIGAMLIWGFGVDAMRRAINHGAVNLDKAPKWAQKALKSIHGVKIKNLSIGLFNDANKPVGEQSAQTLTAEKVKRYQQLQQKQLQAIKASGNEAAAKSLGSTLNKQSSHILNFFDGKTGSLLDKSGSLLGKYKAKEVFKVLGASFIPAAAIGIGLPLIFQTITRGRIQREKKERHINTLNHLNKGLLNNNDAATMSALAQSTATSTQGNGMAGQANAPQFGFVGKLMQKAQDSLIGNTLIVDGTISGGRVVMARNFYDRLENLIQESATIFFLFFAMAPIKNFFYNMFDKSVGTFSKLGLKSSHRLYKELETAPKNVLAKLSDFHNNYVAANDIQLATKGLSKAEKSAAMANFEKALFQSKGLEDYLLKGKSGNVLFDLAKENGLIATHTAGKGAKQAAIWDWTAKVDAEGMYELAQHLKLTTEKLAKRLPNWQQLAKTGVKASHTKKLTNAFGKSIAANGVTWVLAALVCGACQGWVVPKFKQWVTYKLTGRHKFPGEYNEGKRQSLFSIDSTEKLAAQMFA